MKAPTRRLEQTQLAFPSRAVEERQAARPFIKWAGGKRQLLPDLLRFVPREYGAYYEPFLGGAALFFALRPRRAILSDVNERLIRTYRGVGTDVDAVIELLGRWPHDREFFLKLRQHDTSGKSDGEIAAWFIYLNRTAFNGLYRVNRKNQFNVPFGSYVNPTICDPDGLRACGQVLRTSATIRIADFETTVKDARAGDFVYFDPPYVPISAYSNFTRYTSNVFGPADQRRLRDLALELKQRGVTVVLSNSSAPAVFDLYGGNFEIHTVDAKRALNCKGDGRGAVTEVIIH